MPCLYASVCERKEAWKRFKTNLPNISRTHRLIWPFEEASQLHIVDPCGNLVCWLGTPQNQNLKAAQVPALLPVQSQKAVGAFLLEHTVPTTLLVATLAWGLLPERYPQSVTAAAETLKSFLHGFYPHLQVSVLPLGLNEGWQLVGFSPAGMFCEPCLWTPCRETSSLEALWNDQLAARLQ